MIRQLTKTNVIAYYKIASWEFVTFYLVSYFVVF